MTNEPMISELGVLLDRFHDLIRQSRHLPWTGRVLIDEAQLTTLITQIQHILPEEIKQARWIIQERDRILREAGEQADILVIQAQGQVEKLSNESEVLQEARRKADQIVEQARITAREIHKGARAYADEILARLVAELHQVSENLESNRVELRKE
ncbi:MAG: ATPase [Firmicutes bacterium]|jgi:cell division septum initiation protein DivIVA|uniref:ATPase n=1 Tax=Sulfobacillus benefaciens TaxID=453960 RepID=A0A2T2XAH1_9FIRM|nr:ATPase [Bacillota bacterium]MCL5014411.1 ATPase [Bacillota bacterium]PSR31514.1 MAG: ATPase [Sulfobacillus benefaciens]HBQ95797.1 ATPase [Sulfobacillus sp.]